MSRNAHLKQALGRRLTAALLACTLAGCTAGPMSTLDPGGAGAEPITRVWWIMFGGGMAILLFMIALGCYAAMSDSTRRRPRSPLLFVLGGGIAFPLVTLLLLLPYGLRSGHALLPLPTAEPVYRVEVTAHQWWWQIVYPDAEGGPLHSANEIYIPVGRPIDIQVRSADVIHSFWIPRLGGKIDAIPGHTNVVRLRADRPGIYEGQCAEYCGAQHARMRLAVEAFDENDLSDRLSAVAAGTIERPAAPTTASVTFEQYCAECHSLDARVFEPALGPNLADFASRRWIGAGTLPNTPDSLRAWLARHQELKPENRMPSHAFLDIGAIEALAQLLEHRE